MIGDGQDRAADSETAALQGSWGTANPQFCFPFWLPSLLLCINWEATEALGAPARVLPPGMAPSKGATEEVSVPRIDGHSPAAGSSSTGPCVFQRASGTGTIQWITTFMAFILLALATRAPPVPSLKLILKVLSASSKGNSETQRPWNILTAIMRPNAPRQFVTMAKHLMQL
mmetsp:Transcript_34873/g.72665  ORF Transcript_34873/g.72665 Transcript_34873/m.72665 type:complete len:172 (+) Transcript_34873:26-541(+)